MAPQQQGRIGVRRRAAASGRPLAAQDMRRPHTIVLPPGGQMDKVELSVAVSLAYSGPIQDCMSERGEVVAALQVAVADRCEHDG